MRSTAIFNLSVGDEVSKKIVLDILFASTDFKYLFITTENHETPWSFDFFTCDPGPGWVKVSHSGLTKEHILQHQTLIGVMDEEALANPTDSSVRWRQMDPIFDRTYGVIHNIKIREEYLRALYRTSLSEGVQYLETRKPLGAFLMYEMNENATETCGKHYLETPENSGYLEISKTLEILREFIKENPSFIGHKRITRALRIFPVETMRKNLEKAVELHQAHPEHVIGFDLVAEEDSGNSHLYYLENFMENYDAKTQESRIPFYQHTAETNWPDDLITSVNEHDPLATIQNAYEAILLGARRVGHGLGYIKHPHLLSLLRENNVAIETCPVSNQLLGYVPDLRNHPAVHYLRAGVPVVLGTDDPGTFGYDHFTIDWYMVFMAWGLDLSDLKRLATNALEYSGMATLERKKAMGKFNLAWNKYISAVKDEACKAKLDANEPVVGRIFPREGAKTGGTKVHIYGRNFEKAISETLCKGEKVRCRFGSVESEGLYVSNYHIICESPPPTNDKVVGVEVQLADVWLSSKQNFTYRHDVVTTADDSPTEFSTTASTSADGRFQGSYMISIFVFVTLLASLTSITTAKCH